MLVKGATVRQDIEVSKNNNKCLKYFQRIDRPMICEILAFYVFAELAGLCLIIKRLIECDHNIYHQSSAISTFISISRFAAFWMYIIEI